MIPKMYFMILSVHRGSVSVGFVDQHCPLATGYCENIVKLQRREIRFAKKKITIKCFELLFSDSW